MEKVQAHPQAAARQAAAARAAAKTAAEQAATLKAVSLENARSDAEERARAAGRQQLEQLKASRLQEMAHRAVSTEEEHDDLEEPSEAEKAATAAKHSGKPVKMGDHHSRMLALPHEALKTFQSSHHAPKTARKEDDDGDDTELKRLPEKHHRSWLEDHEDHVATIAELTGAKPQVKRGDELAHIFDKSPSWKLGKPKKLNFVPKFNKEKKPSVMQRFGVSEEDDDEEAGPYTNKAKLIDRLHPFVKPSQDRDNVDPDKLVVSRTGRVLGVRKPGDILEISDKQADVDLAAIGALGEKVLGLEMKDMDGADGPQKKIDSLYAAGDIDRTYGMSDMQYQVQAALAH